MGKLKINGAADLSGLLSAHGGISLNSTTENATPDYILGIKPFDDGGNIIWQDKNNVTVGAANKWTTGRWITLNGPVVGSVKIDGSNDVLLATHIGPMFLGTADNDEEFMNLLTNYLSTEVSTDTVHHVSIMMHGRHSVTIHRHLAGYITIEDITYQPALTGDTFYYRRIRWMYNNQWSQWEYDNPPVGNGGEYATTERYAGRVVYTQLFRWINGEASTNLEYVYITDIPQSGVKVIRYAGHDSGLPFPIKEGSVVRKDINISRNGTNYMIIAHSQNANWAVRSFDVQLWYIKE